MINKKSKLIHFFLILSLAFIAITFSSYNNSYAEHCETGQHHDINDNCVDDVCTDSSSDCSDPCNDGSDSSCGSCPTGTHGTPPNCIDDVCVSPETGEYPDCGECSIDQHGSFPDCIDNVCVSPETGTYPDCGQCTSDETGTYPNCVPRVCVSPETGTYPDCGECTSDQTGTYPNCVAKVCVSPQEGTYPSCGTCTVSGTSGYPTCNCTSTGNAPTGTPLSCTGGTCCDDPAALNVVPTCPNVPNNVSKDNTTCEFCTKSNPNNDVRCKVYYCSLFGAVNFNTQQSCDANANNQDKECVVDDSMCEFVYCNDSTHEPSNYDPGGADCSSEHTVGTCSQDNDTCIYDPVDYCDVSNRHPITDEEPTNGYTQQECEQWNERHTCVDDSNVCAYPCTGGDCAEIAYCSDSLCGNYDAGGASCNATNPAGSTCVASLSSCTSCTPYPYCGIPGFMNYSNGAGCTDFHSACVSDISQCEGTASCNVGFEVDIVCDSTFTFSGTFDYVYDYDNTEQCTEPNAEELTAIANYLEAKVCDITPPPAPCSDPSDPLCKVDWCTDETLFPGVQTDPDDCPIDVCPDVEGVQTTDDECLDAEICSDGYYFDEDTGCEPIDICSNIDLNQVEMPAGKSFNSSGYCVNGAGQSSSASCGEITNNQTPQTDDANIYGSIACSTGIFGGYVELNPRTNPDTYSWDCYDIRNGGAHAYCTAPKGTAALCGIATSEIYTLNDSLSSITGVNACNPGTINPLSLERTETIPLASNPSLGGEAYINWDCNYGVSSVSCQAYSTECEPTTKWCLASKECIPNASECPPVFLELSSKLKTSTLVNKGEYCTIYLRDSITEAGKDTLCYVENVGKGEVVKDTFAPYNGNQWQGVETFHEILPITADTTYKLTCWQDTEQNGVGGVGNGAPDSSEIKEVSEGSCRLNVNLTEFN